MFFDIIDRSNKQKPPNEIENQPNIQPKRDHIVPLPFTTSVLNTGYEPKYIVSNTRLT